MACLAILAFVIFYKFGDALAGTMSNPLYVLAGFTKVELANFGKIYRLRREPCRLGLGGVRGAAARHLAGAPRLRRAADALKPDVRAASVGPVTSLVALAFTIGVENLTGGMGSAAFVAYLSGLCNIAFTATQYALLSSLAAVGRTTLSASGGALADIVGWSPFFILATAACLPGLAILLWIMREEVEPPTPMKVIGTDTLHQRSRTSFAALNRRRQRHPRRGCAAGAAAAAAAARRRRGSSSRGNRRHRRPSSPAASPRH